MQMWGGLPQALFRSAALSMRKLLLLGFLLCKPLLGAEPLGLVAFWTGLGLGGRWFSEAGAAGGALGLGLPDLPQHWPIF